MRIRKNMKLFSSSSSSLPLSLSNDSVLQTQVCQLNQSPWDVMPLSPLSPSPDRSQPEQHQHQGIVLSSIATGASKESYFIEEEEEEENKVLYGSRMEGKCMAEAKDDNSVTKLPAKGNGSVKATTTTVETRSQNCKSAVSCTMKASDYYFYSGFGPRWAKKRGERREGRDGCSEAHLQIAPPPILSHSDQDRGNKNHGINYKKKPRKPAKTRSLKSLINLK